MEPLSEKFRKMKTTISMIKTEINSMQQKLSSHLSSCSFSTSKSNNNPLISHISYSQHKNHQSFNITSSKTPVSNAHKKNKKLIDYKRRIQRNENPIILSLNNPNRSNYRKFNSELIKQISNLFNTSPNNINNIVCKLNRTGQNANRVDHEVICLYNVYKETFNPFAENRKNDYYIDMKKWVQKAIFKRNMYNKQIEIYKKMINEIIQGNDLSDVDEVAAFINDKLPNQHHQKFQNTIRLHKSPSRRYNYDYKYK